MELKSLLFDVDGTLAETEEVHRLAFNTAFAESGLNWHWDSDRYHELLKVSGGKERIRHDIAQSRPDMLAWPDIDALIADLHQIKTRCYTEAVAQGRIALRPGVARLIEEARAAGLRLAIVTTTSRANVDALLAARAAAVPVLVTESLYSRGEDFTGALAVVRPGRAGQAVPGNRWHRGRHGLGHARTPATAARLSRMNHTALPCRGILPR